VKQEDGIGGNNESQNRKECAGQVIHYVTQMGVIVLQLGVIVSMTIAGFRRHASGCLFADCKSGDVEIL